MRKLKLLPLFALLLSALAAFAADEYKIDPVHSNASFSVKHLLVSTVRGRFTQVNGTILIDDADMTKSSVNAVISTPSITTDNESRDKHLKSPAFFEVEKYPEITFKSTKVEKTADGYVATGLLTIKDVSKEVRLPFTIAKGDAHGKSILGVETATQIDRFDYHISYDSTGATVSKEVKIEINLEAGKAAAAPAAPKNASITTK
jgi:polyisoprenoid-binding protein YceI